MFRNISSLLALLFYATVRAFPSNSNAQNSRNTSQTGYTFGTAGVNATFDFVVVGGGTAGLTIATRFAEKPGISVAVIEAGGFYEQDNGNLSVVPGYAFTGNALVPGVGVNPLVDWNFNTTPQTGADNRVMHYARGKTLGGSSARNSLYYQRPSLGSMQKWADEVGDQSFTFANLLQYYKKSVHLTLPVIQYPNGTNQQDLNAFSPSGGPLQVSFGHYNDPWSSWAQKGLLAIGQTLIKGFSSGVLLGTSFMAWTEEPITERRSSSESSFLESTKTIKTQLTVYKNTFAHKIVFDGPKNRAEGVIVAPEGEYGPDKGAYALFASKEIILSAGALQSPQLLMISGIGPSAMLREHDIKVLKDLPGVGQTLSDHPCFGTTFQVNLDPSPSNPVQVSEYNQNPPIGPLTNPGNPVVGWDNLPPTHLSPSTLETLSQQFTPDWPHLEWLAASQGLGNATEGVYRSIVTALVAPLSRGSVGIRSARMADSPIINFNYLTHPIDQEVAIAAFKRQRQFWSKLSPPSSSITIGTENLPGPSVHSDAQILAYIRSRLTPLWHASATCKMGRPGDSAAVVDARFRVFGTQRLRIVDASVFPFLPPGHPQSTVYALAEKAAVEVLEGVR